MEQSRNGFNWEINGFDVFFNHSGDEAWAKGDEDNMAGLEAEW